MTSQPTDNRTERPSSTEQAPDRPVRQLDAIIENLTAYAAPVLREIAARAAELAAKAGQAAGPMAHRAADMTEEIGERVAGRSRDLATDLRRDPASGSPTLADDAPAGGGSYVAPGTPPGDAGTEAWADTRAGSIVGPGSATTPADTFIDESRQ